MIQSVVRYIVSFAGLVDQLGSVLERALSRQGKEKDVAHVDLDSELTKCGLSECFLVDSWPPSMAVCVLAFRVRQSFICSKVRELATKVRSALKAGQVKPFVAVDLKKYAYLCRQRYVSFAA